MSPYAAHEAPIDRAPNIHGNADPDVMAHRRQPLDAERIRELALWNAAQARARAAYRGREEAGCCATDEEEAMSDVNRIKAEALREAADDFDVDREGRRATEHPWCLRINCAECITRDLVLRLRARADALGPQTAADMSGDTRGVGG